MAKLALSTANKDKAAIKRVFKGQQDAFRHIIERYQPVVYTVALAQTGHVVLADKAVTAAFKEGYERLVSLTDASRLGHWLCALARKEGELLTNSRTPDRLKPRDRDPSAVNVDLAWLQNELVDPLFEELGPFKVQERIGLLLFTLCGATPRTISNLLKIDLKEAREDLDRTRENVEKALLKEFETYRSFTGRKIKESRLEVLRAGFRAAWAAKDYKTIIGIANKLPEETLQEDEKLLTLYDLALTRTEDGL